MVAASGRAYRRDRRRGRLHPRPSARQLPVQRVRQEPAVRRQRRTDRARLRARHHRLAGRARRVQRPGPADAGQAAAGRDPAGRGGSRPVEVLQVHPGPQGRRHPVPVRHDRLLPDRRPVRDGDQGRAAVADLPPHRAESVPGGGGRARHDDDDDDVLSHPRPVRPVLWPAADRVQAGRVPADRGPRLLAHPGLLRDPAFRHLVRRVPDRLDRLRTAGHPGWTGHGRVLLRVRPDGDLDDPGRLQHDRHHHQLPGPRHALEPGSPCSSGRCLPSPSFRS